MPVRRQGRPHSRETPCDHWICHRREPANQSGVRSARPADPQDQPARRLIERGRHPAIRLNIVEYETDTNDVTGLAEALAASLEAEKGWYSDFADGDVRVVVFAGKVFRYRRGDETGRADAIAYGRSVGTPEHQLDWRE
ncbi:hypothetical protein [Streptomyces sp. NPDC002088]|uniref:hypothetical protein n=1 Tax=Streptomyces sp. NPDC002088 TaxID=3154665 RepID=UPI00331FEC51